jgi:cytochrome c556
VQFGRTTIAFSSLVVALAVVLLAASSGQGFDEAKLEISNWKEILPDSEFTKLVEASSKVISDYAKSPSSLNLNAKKLENEAYGLIVYAEVVRRGEGDLAKRAAALQGLAVKLAAAAKGKNAEEAKELAKSIAGFKSLKPEDEAAALKLADAVPMHNLMENVQTINKEMTKYRRLTSAQFSAKGKPEEILQNAYRMAALSVAITAHVPTKDLPKGKTGADWLKSTEDMRKATLDLAAAAKAKKFADVRTSINKMDSACTKCHEDFRVETN